MCLLALFFIFIFILLAGVYLPKLCEAQGENARRGMAEIKSSGIVAPGPTTPGKFLAAPGPVSTEKFIESPALSPAF